MNIKSLLPKSEIQRVFDNFHVVAFQDSTKGAKYPVTCAYVLCDGLIYTVSNHKHPEEHCVVNRWCLAKDLAAQLKMQKAWRGYRFFTESSNPERHIVDYEFFANYEEA